MQSAFLGRCVLPPPAAFALVHSGVGRASARLTSNADESVRVQRVVRHLDQVDFVPQIRALHVSKRVELHKHSAILALEYGVHLSELHVNASRALIFTNTGDPCLQLRELALQRSDLTDATAFLMPILIE